MSANYFFLADERLEHYRVRYTVLDLISKLGGFVGLMMAIVKYIGQYLAINFSIGKIIKMLESE